MTTSTLLIPLVAATLLGAPIPQQAVQRQDETFQRLWGTSFEWKFEELPTEGTVPSFRVPYSGYIYPDKGGGTVNAMRKYDMAFNGGRMLATGWEQWDTTAIKKPQEKRGPLGLLRRTVMDTPNWHGHCNGWAAAGIRHAEPKDSVRINGVSFTPADIKALLAEIYIYNDYIHLAGLDENMNAGLLHAILANWLGRGRHPIGMEADPGEEKWNYPVYGFSSSSARRSPRRVEVKVNVAYAKDTSGEYQEGPRNSRVKYFHYALDLDANGKIIGGSFYPDSALIDMLWIPLRPKQGRQKGNEPGCPYVDVNKVLAVWRASVPEEERKEWLIIDPPKEDRVLEIADASRLIPLQDVTEPGQATAAVPPKPAPAVVPPPESTATTPPAETRETAGTSDSPHTPDTTGTPDTTDEPFEGYLTDAPDESDPAETPDLSGTADPSDTSDTSDMSDAPELWDELGEFSDLEPMIPDTAPATLPATPAAVPAATPAAVPAAAPAAVPATAPAAPAKAAAVPASQAAEPRPARERIPGDARHLLQLNEAHD